jgi:hypothetical protein
MPAGDECALAPEKRAQTILVPTARGLANPSDLAQPVVVFTIPRNSGFSPTVLWSSTWISCLA